MKREQRVLCYRPLLFCHRKHEVESLASADGFDVLLNAFNPIVSPSWSTTIVSPKVRVSLDGIRGLNEDRLFGFVAGPKRVDLFRVQWSQFFEGSL